MKTWELMLIIVSVLCSLTMLIVLSFDSINTYKGFQYIGYATVILRTTDRGTIVVRVDTVTHKDYIDTIPVDTDYELPGDTLDVKIFVGRWSKRIELIKLYK